MLNNVKYLLNFFLFIISMSVKGYCLDDQHVQSVLTGQKRIEILRDKGQRIQILDELKCKVNAHLDHLNDMKENTIIISMNEFLISKNENGILNQLNEKFNNVKMFTDFFVILEQYNDNKPCFSIFLESSLCSFLKTRLSDLYSRKKNFYEMTKNKNEGMKCIYAWSTDPDQQDKLLDPEFFEIEKMVAEITTDTYQTKNEIIRQLCSMVRLNDLSAETQKYLRLSPSLWPLIMGESNELGHPDQAIFENQDVDLYEQRILHLKGAVIRRESIICPLFSENVQKPASAVPEMLMEEQDFLPPKKTKKKKKKKTISADAALNDLEPHEQLDGAENVVLPEKGLEDNINPEDNINEVQPEQVIFEKIEDSEILTDASAYCISHFNDNQILKEPVENFDPKTDHELHQLMKTQKKTSTETTEQLTIFDKLGGSSAVTCDKLLNEKLPSVTYHDFKTLWEYLGGTIASSGRGGSHRRLIFNGRVVGGTFKPHGNSDYGYRSVRYLKQALEIVLQQKN